MLMRYLSPLSHAFVSPTLHLIHLHTSSPRSPLKLRQSGARLLVVMEPGRVSLSLSLSPPARVSDHLQCGAEDYRMKGRQDKFCVPVTIFRLSVFAGYEEGQPSCLIKYSYSNYILSWQVQGGGLGTQDDGEKQEESFSNL